MTDATIHPAGTPPADRWDDPRHGRVDFRSILEWAEVGAPGLVQGVASLAPGDEVHRHRHDRPESGYVLSGRGRLLLEDRAVPIGPGDAVAVPAGVLHGWRAEGSAPLEVLYSFPADRFDDVAYRYDGD